MVGVSFRRGSREIPARVRAWSAPASEGDPTRGGTGTLARPQGCVPVQRWWQRTSWSRNPRVVCRPKCRPSQPRRADVACQEFVL